MSQYNISPLAKSASRMPSTPSKQGHVCLGISPFNSYFTTPRMVSLIQWAMQNFEQVEFYIPDEAAAYTLQAQGYDRKKAMHKARRQGKYLKNKVKTACAEAGLLEPSIYDAARLREVSAYTQLQQDVRQRFEQDAVLREAVMTTSGWILDKRLPEGVTASQEQNLLAVEYFLEELPLFVDSPAIFSQPESVFVYHQRVDFLQRLFAGQLPLSPVATQDFWVVSPVDEPATELANEFVPEAEAAD